MNSGEAHHRHVTVEGVRLRFAAAHMATLGEELEPLHGHNYEVRCRVDGDLTADRWVIDFSVLKRLAREACERLDHRFLLQERSTRLQVVLEGAEWVVTHGDRRYRLPASDVLALPIENTTAELLAEWIWEEVAAGLARGAHANVVTLSVEVEEMPGQAGGYARALPRPEGA